MLKYVKSELYKSFNRIYFYTIIVSVAIFAVGIELLIKISGTTAVHMNLMELVKLTINPNILTLPIYLILMITDMVLSEEYKNKTLKNEVAFGVSRNEIIISKFIAAVILVIIAVMAIVFVTYVTGALLFGVGEVGSKETAYYGSRTLVLCGSIVLWLAALAITFFLTNVFTNPMTFSFIYVGVIIVPSIIIKLLSVFIWPRISVLNGFLITGQFSSIGKITSTSGDVVKAVLLGAAYIIIFMSLSLIKFRKQDI